MIEHKIPVVTYIIMNVAETSYPFRWDMKERSTVVVSYEDHPLVENVDYVVRDLTATGGRVDIRIPTQRGDALRIARNTPIDQVLDYLRGGVFNTQSLETQLDHTVMNVQESSAKGVLNTEVTRKLIILLKEQVALFDHRVRITETDIQKLRADVDQLEIDYYGLNKRQDNTNSRLKAHETQSATQLQQHEQDIGALRVVDTQLQTKTSANSSNLATNNQKIQTLSKKSSAHDTAINTLVPTQASLVQDVSSNSVRITRLESGTAPVGSLVPIYDKLTIHDGEIQKLKAKDVGHDASILSLNGTVGAHNTLLANADLPQMKVDVSENTTGVATNKTDITNLDSRLTASEFIVKGHQTAITTNVTDISNLEVRTSATESRSLTNKGYIDLIHTDINTIKSDYAKTDYVHAYMEGKAHGYRTELANTHLDTLDSPTSLYLQPDIAMATTAQGYPENNQVGTLDLNTYVSGSQQIYTTSLGVGWSRFKPTVGSWGAWEKIGGKGAGGGGGGDSLFGLSGQGTPSDPWLYPPVNTTWNVYNYKQTGYFWCNAPNHSDGQYSVAHSLHRWMYRFSVIECVVTPATLNDQDFIIIKYVALNSNNKNFYNCTKVTSTGAWTFHQQLSYYDGHS